MSGGNDFPRHPGIHLRERFCFTKNVPPILPSSWPRLSATFQDMSATTSSTLPDARGHFGPYGGRYVPETLMHPLQELEEEYFRSQQDPEFQRELQYYLREFCGRPTPLYFADRLTL